MFCFDIKFTLTTFLTDGMFFVRFLFEVLSFEFWFLTKLSIKTLNATVNDPSKQCN